MTPAFVLQAVARAKPEPDASPDTSHADDRVIGLGFTASRRVGGAVARNRAKRRLRAAARDLVPALGSAGTSYVLVAREPVLTCPFPALTADLERALQAHAARITRGQSRPVPKQQDLVSPPGS